MRGRRIFGMMLLEKNVVTNSALLQHLERFVGLILLSSKVQIGTKPAEESEIGLM